MKRMIRVAPPWMNQSRGKKHQLFIYIYIKESPSKCTFAAFECQASESEKASSAQVKPNTIMLTHYTITDTNDFKSTQRDREDVYSKDLK